MIIKLVQKYFDKNISFLKDLSAISLILVLYLIPLNIYGYSRLEDYFSSYLGLNLALDYKNFLIPFYDLIGPGSKMPIGYGLDFLFPHSIFINNIKLFYFVVLITCFYIQLNYWKKLLKIFKLDNVILIFFFYALGVTPIFYILSGDALKIILGYSLVIPITYYLFKFILLRNKFDLLKIIIFSTYCFSNTHIVYTLTIFILVFAIIAFNRKFFFIKKTYFYFAVLLALAISAYKILIIFSDINLYSIQSERVKILEFSLINYTSGIVFILKFLEQISQIDFSFIGQFKEFDNFYLPFNGLIFYFALFESFKLLYKRKSDEIYFLNLVLIFLVLISISKLNKYLFIFGSGYVFKDVIYFVSLIIFASFLKKIINIKLKFFIISFCIITVLPHYFLSVQNMKVKTKEYNIFNHNKTLLNNKNSKIFSEVGEDNLSKKKIYLSEKIWKDIEKQSQTLFLELNIFHHNDLLKYKLYPFNYYFKNSAKPDLRNSKNLFYTEIEPRVSEIENKYFFEFFNIEYLMIYNTELENVDLKNFYKFKELKLDEDNILILKRKNNYSLTFKNKDSLKKEVAKCSLQNTFFSCLPFKENLFDLNENISFKRESLNKYSIINNSSLNTNVVVPFLFDKNWKSKNEIKNLNEKIMYIEILPNEKVSIYYSDNLRIFIELLSKIIFVISIFYIFRKKFILKY